MHFNYVSQEQASASMEVLFEALPSHQIASAHSLPSQSPGWETLKQYFVVHITWQQKGQGRDASAVSGYPRWRNVPDAREDSELAGL